MLKDAEGLLPLEWKLRWKKIVAPSWWYIEYFTLFCSSFWTQTILIPIPNHISINLKYDQVRTKSFQWFSDISTTLMMPLPLILTENPPAKTFINMPTAHSRRQADVIAKK